MARCWNDCKTVGTVICVRFMMSPCAGSVQAQLVLV